MRIFQIHGLTLSKPIAYTYENKENNELYYNISIGMDDLYFKQYILKLDAKYFKPKSIDDKLELSDDNYILKPYLIPHSNNIYRVKKNQVYMISKNNSHIQRSDILLLWEIPNKQYTNVKYKTEGFVNVIAEASAGRYRNNKIYSSPCPVLEIFGDCKLSWIGTDINGNKFSQNIEYNTVSDKIEIQAIYPYLEK